MEGPLSSLIRVCTCREVNVPGKPKLLPSEIWLVPHPLTWAQTAMLDQRDLHEAVPGTFHWQFCPELLSFEHTGEFDSLHTVTQQVKYLFCWFCSRFPLPGKVDVLSRSDAWQCTTKRFMSQSEIWYWLILWCVHLMVRHRAEYKSSSSVKTMKTRRDLQSTNTFPFVNSLAKQSSFIL